jgi:hypothetical protein
MAPASSHPNDLIDEIEMVEEQPLIIHADLGACLDYRLR